ncbi:hypothetical protein EUAN_23630 [Andreesenia angusta]|uniref:DUF2922 family protein n=1 Tax=Andreesenia angusta TaxID=39480 RepID=A0A1S1V3U6_9FIRM|nr:hypothetical protein [Andreesenia angusta]OHW61282.1 hypothetical protein EUAN_23630 [Andreesenia angusta]
MELLRTDLQLEVVLANGEEDKFLIRDVNPEMSDLYVTEMAGLIANTFEIKGQNITRVKDVSIIKTNRVQHELPA